MTRRFLVCGLVLTLLLSLSVASYGDGKSGAKLPARPGERGAGEDEEVGGDSVAAGWATASRPIRSCPSSR